MHRELRIGSLGFGKLHKALTSVGSDAASDFCLEVKTVWLRSENCLIWYADILLSELAAALHTEGTNLGCKSGSYFLSVLLPEYEMEAMNKGTDAPRMLRTAESKRRFCVIHGISFEGKFSCRNLPSNTSFE